MNNDRGEPDRARGRHGPGVARPIQVELRAQIVDQGAPSEFAEATVRSVVARLTEAPANLHQSTPGFLPTSYVDFAC
jgi:hypothetical protein